MTELVERVALAMRNKYPQTVSTDYLARNLAKAALAALKPGDHLREDVYVTDANWTVLVHCAESRKHAAEDMRERAAQEVEQWLSHGTMAKIVAAIRALPLEEKD